MNPWYEDTTLYPNLLELTPEQFNKLFEGTKTKPAEIAKLKEQVEKLKSSGEYEKVLRTENNYVLVRKL